MVDPALRNAIHKQRGVLEIGASLSRSFRKQVARAKNVMINGVFPQAPQIAYEKLHLSSGIIFYADW